MNGARANLIVGIVIGFIGLLAAVAGILWLDARAVYLLTSQFRSASYPQTTGRIQHSQLRFEQGGRRSFSSYEVEVAYTYEVDGQAYQGKKYRFTSTISQREEGPKRIVSELPAGKEVAVYYNPRDPAEAVLAPGTSPADFLFVHLLVPFNCFLVIFAGVTWRLARCGPIRREVRPSSNAAS